ncbi:hypothetical protein ACHHYP_01915 [Achlya hypogyna]|uniref:Secreted protein n=1 Tax=Achlya hypogyna TaxID=1202772 RepID=A0A0A7CMV7_ACHHY|nr:secreted protein [Achlya hypogyna]OQR94011.1 hypothetical protein ACHHYP_01915 [Achlya hypogyna]
MRCVGPLLALLAVAVAEPAEPPAFNNSDIMGWLGNYKKGPINETDLIWSITMEGAKVGVDTTKEQIQWEKIYRVQGDILRNDKTNLCLEATGSGDIYRLYGAPCNASSPDQSWNFAYRRLEHALHRNQCVTITSEKSTWSVEMQRCSPSATVPRAQKIRFFR